MNNSRLGIALSMLLLQSCPLVVAQSAADNLIAQGTAAGDGVTNYSTGESPPAKDVPKVDTENWPWLQKDKSQTEGGGTQSQAPSSSREAAPLPPGLKMETPEVSPSGGLKPETPQSSGAGGFKTEKPAVAPAASVAPKQAAEPAKAKAFKLYGRIDQLFGSSGASFPTLKAETPKMDARGVKIQAHAAHVAQSVFSGAIVKSFPTDYAGTWGGQLQAQVVQIDPGYYSIDPEMARRTAQAMRVGAVGAVNFQFANLAAGKVSLEPARILFMVPAKDTVQGDQMSAMFGQAGGANNPMGDMLKNMTANMNVPVVVSFGESPDLPGAVSVTGGQIHAKVLKNEIRQLGPGVLEQDIVSQVSSWDKGVVHNGFTETVIRFTARNSQQMYAQAASVDFSDRRRFEMKTVFAGWITKGQVMNTDPMSAMGAGAGGLGNLQQMMGRLGAGGGQQMPGLENMLKNMFGQ